jgi:hypothetical protein
MTTATTAPSLQTSAEELTALLATVNSGSGPPEHSVANPAPTVFTWEYERSRPRLAGLYEKAKASQWNGNDLPWDTEVDQERMAMTQSGLIGGFGAGADLTGTAFARWDEKQWVELGMEGQNWMLSQFLHGEQGALVCTAKLAQSVPWIDAKYYAATQVMDEARHVEVFARYLDEKLSGHYPVNAHLAMLLDDIVADARWDMTFLGMQIMVEGLALAAFGLIRQLTDEPLLDELLRRVMADEARHVALGVLSLAEIYLDMTQAEIRERQEFAYEAALRMRDRFLMQEVWERMGAPVAEAVTLVRQSPERALFQQMLFAKIVPNCKKLGLLDAGDGWLRERFTEMGIIGFEHADDSEGE